MEGEEVESGGEVVGGDGELSGVERDGEEFMACGVVEGEAAAVEVGERGGECEGDGLACGVGVEGEEGFGVGRRDGAGRPLGFEVGYESGVLGNGKGEGVVGDAVVPVREVESGPWGGFDGLEGGVVVVGGVERQALCGVIGKELDMALVFGDNAERPPFPFISTT